MARTPGYRPGQSVIADHPDVGRGPERAVVVENDAGAWYRLRFGDGAVLTLSASRVLGAAPPLPPPPPPARQPPPTRGRVLARKVIVGLLIAAALLAAAWANNRAATDNGGYEPDVPMVCGQGRC